MENKRWVFIISYLLLTLCNAGQIIGDQQIYHSATFLNRSSFPHDFIFGAASSSYQNDGAVKEDGGSPSIWDHFTHTYPGAIKDGSNGDIATDSYHRYKEDVWIIKEIGLDAYRLSISWSRLLPKGRLNGGINWDGIRYFNNFINELIDNGIKPFVTLAHGDHPQALEDAYGGLLSRNFVDDFRDYAELCFEQFGDRVKHWVTINEPHYYDIAGYATGLGPPHRCSSWLHLNCSGGDSGTEPYIVAHHLLLAHAAAANLYKQKYQASQKGEIGIVLSADWYVPLSNSTQDQEATQRSLDFRIGWFMEPLTSGRYPNSMISIVKDRLPKMTKEQSMMIKGSYDFIGVNYYTASYVADSTPSSHNESRFTYYSDWHANLTTQRDGIPIGPKYDGGSCIYPRGIRDLLLYMKKKYSIQMLYVTENGISEPNNSSLSLKEALHDPIRIDYLYQHLNFVREAIQYGVNVKGYIVWSLLDNFEWGLGYTVRYGMIYVDFQNGLKRYPKSSAFWFKKFLQKENKSLGLY